MSDILILTLACWRLSSLLVNENGPYEAFEQLRYWLGVRINEQSESYGNNIVGELFSCIWCLSFWIGLILMIAYVFYPTQMILACLPFALSAGAILVNKWMQ